MNGLPVGGTWRTFPDALFGEIALSLDPVRGLGEGTFRRPDGFYGEIKLDRVSVATVTGTWAERGVDNRVRRSGKLAFVLMVDGEIVMGRWETDDGTRKGIFMATPTTLRHYNPLDYVPAWCLPEEVVAERHAEALAESEAAAEAEAASEAESQSEESEAPDMFSMLLAMYHQQEAEKAADAVTDGAEPPPAEEPPEGR